MSTKADFIQSQHKRLMECITTLREFLEESDVESITIDRDKTIAKLKVPNLALYINEEDQRSIAIETLNFKVYEKNDSRMIYGVLNWVKRREKHPIIFDIGANEGIYTIKAALEGIKVHAFEAAPETYKRLLENIELNNVESVRTINKAVSNSEGRREFVYCPEISGSSSFKDILNMEGSEKIDVDTISLDNYCKVNEVTPHFLKIDVEGAEKQVIEGFMDTLIKGKKPILFVEILRKWSEKYGYDADHLLKLITDQKYKAFVYDQNEGVKEVFEISEETIETNFLFIPNSMNHGEIIEEIEAMYAKR